MKNLPALLALSMLLLAATGCGGDSRGYCVVPSPVHPGDPDWNACYDDYSQAECDEMGAPGESYKNSWQKDWTCEETGYTLQCPNEPNTWRLPAYGC